MKEIETKLVVLKQNIEKLIHLHQGLTEENFLLRQEISRLSSQSHTNIESLQTESESLNDNVSSTENTLVKARIRVLVEELDRCIARLE